MIGVSGLSKRYGDVNALDDVSFEVLPGELAFVIGASGSGKTTLLRLLHGDLRADGGSIHIDGVDVTRLRRRTLPRYRRLVSIVPQDHRLLSGRTVADNLAFSLGVLGWRRRPAQRRIDDVLLMVGLDGYRDRLPHELSGGERQRVVIARAIAGYPLVLLCDEPTGNLDPDTSDGIVRLLEYVAAGGTTVVMSTHDAGVVDAARRRVLELEHGRLVRADATGGYRSVARPPHQSGERPPTLLDALPTVPADGAGALAALVADYPPIAEPVIPATAGSWQEGTWR